MTKRIAARLTHLVVQSQLDRTPSRSVRVGCVAHEATPVAAGCDARHGTTGRHAAPDEQVEQEESELVRPRIAVKDLLAPIPRLFTARATAFFGPKYQLGGVFVAQLESRAAERRLHVALPGAGRRYRGRRSAHAEHGQVGVGTGLISMKVDFVC